jgi:hypothetical protein
MEPLANARMVDRKWRMDTKMIKESTVNRPLCRFGVRAQEKTRQQKLIRAVPIKCELIRAIAS